MTTHHWSTLKLLDVDGGPVRDPETIRHALAQLQSRGSMTDYFLARVGESHEETDDASTWGPRDADIDWSGFDAEPR